MSTNLNTANFHGLPDPFRGFSVCPTAFRTAQRQWTLICIHAKERRMVFDPRGEFRNCGGRVASGRNSGRNGVRLKAGVRSTKKQLSLGDINALKIRNVSRTTVNSEFPAPITIQSRPPALIVEDDGTIWEVVASYGRVSGTQWEVIARRWVPSIRWAHEYSPWR